MTPTVSQLCLGGIIKHVDSSRRAGSASSRRAQKLKARPTKPPMRPMPPVSDDGRGDLADLIARYVALPNVPTR